MNDVILTTPSELSAMIYDQVRKALSEHEPTPVPEPDRWMTVEELRGYLPEHPQVQTIYTGCANKRIPFNKQGKRLYFLKSEIDTWLKSGRRKTFAEMQQESGRGKR